MIVVTGSWGVKKRITRDAGNAEVRGNVWESWESGSTAEQEEPNRAKREVDLRDDFR